MRKIFDAILFLMSTLVIASLIILSMGCTRYVYLPTEPDPEPQATPTPATGPCRFPQGLDYVTYPGTPRLHDRLNSAMSAVLECAPFTECRWPGFDPQSFYQLLGERLRSNGLCAGQPEEGRSDEIAVSESACGDWEIYHAWHFGGERPLWALPRENKCVGLGCGNPFRGLAKPNSCK